MSKRPRPWGNDYERQVKTRLNEKTVNANKPEYMNEVYERTTSLLFEGAKKLQRETKAGFSQWRTKHNNLEQAINSDVEMDSDFYPTSDKKNDQLVCTSESPLDEAEECSHIRNPVNINKKNSQLTNSEGKEMKTELKKYRQIRLDKLFNSVGNLKLNNRKPIESIDQRVIV